MGAKYEDHSQAKGVDVEKVGEVEEVAWVPDPGSPSDPPDTDEFDITICVFDINGKTHFMRAVVDTGAAQHFISTEKAELLKCLVEPYKGSRNQDANGQTLHVLGKIRAQWYKDGRAKTFWDSFGVVNGAPWDVIIGRPRFRDMQKYGLLDSKPVFVLMRAKRNKQAKAESQRQEAAYHATTSQEESAQTANDLQNVSEWKWSEDHRRWYRLVFDAKGTFVKHEWDQQTT